MNLRVQWSDSWFPCSGVMMKGPVHCFAVLLLTGLCSAVPAGRDFATVFMQNYLHEDVKHARFQIEVTAPPTSQGTTDVTVTALGKVYQQKVHPGNGAIFQLPDDVEMSGSERFHKTVLIKASQEVTVVSLNYKDETADTSVLYPINEWGTEYYVFTPPSYQQGTYKEFAITNHQHRNTILIFLRGSVTFEGKHYSSGSKLIIQLEPFESVQIQSQDDLSGSKVISELPVAVLSGHTCAQKYTGCNHVYEQLLPVKSWGKEFIIAPLHYHYNAWFDELGIPYTHGHDSVYVQASEPTTVTKNVGGKVNTFQMHAGQTYEIESKWPSTIYLTSDKAIQVLFEFNGGPINTATYFDPFMINILPTTQFSVSYALDGQEGFNNLAILVARSNTLDGIKLDNSPLPSHTKWSKVDGSEYSFTVLSYGTTAGFNQITHHESPFGVYSFGNALANGYGSAASANEIRDCRTIKCQKDEECKMSGTSPVCVKKPPVVKAGTCWVMGDPHYRTFDGHYFNILGNCTYTMAKNCHVDKSHPAFEVEARNENHAGSKATVVGEVIIKVYDYTITIVRSEYGLVRMDYTLWNLPMNLGNGKVRLSQSGLSVLMETEFGLTVLYDWEQHLVINVPGSFAGKVCGLCGNFNDKEEDDLTTPSGSVASSTVDFGKSWRVPNVDGHCSDECTGKCESCAHQGFFADLRDQAFCGLLSHIMDGPLRDCKAVVEPKVYHKNCLYDVCMGEGLQEFLCDSLEVYSDACQRAGVQTYNWRKLALCPEPSCPENSHYEFCGEACPATCDDPDAPSKCKQSCVEACACDEGYLRSGTKCVPKAQCGCNYNGRYIEASHTVWADGNERCTERCTCNPASKRMECNATKCGTGRECKVVDGIRECHPKAHATCTVYGDPHYTTFDGRHYDFQGTCVYQMAGVCSSSDPKLTHFSVNVQNDGRGKTAGSDAKLVEVEVYGSSIVISRDHKGSVLVNTELVNLPVVLESGITIRQSGIFAEIRTNFGLQVSYDWQSTVFITVPSSYAGIMCGLCGNYNLNAKDDLKMKNGKQAASAEELGKSWRVAEIPGCVDGCKDKNHCPSCDITLKEKFETNDYCGKIKDPKGPFAKCHAVEHPDEYFKDCVFDVCLNNGKKGSWCSSFSTYTRKCQEQGVEVDQWRKKDFCPASELPRPAHSHYEHCASPCHATCGHVTPPRGACKKACLEGWACNNNKGFILSGDKCVPFKQCGCHYKGRYYQKGEKFYPNGLCKEECICNGTVQCKKYTCGPDERCEVKKGVRSCQPFGHGKCTISGDPHYKTFDNGTYDFQGTCTYTAAKACHLEGTRLNLFSVVVENEKWYAMSADPRVSVAKLVTVEVYRYVLTLRKDELGVIMVNGVLLPIPLNLNKGAIQVYQEGLHYVIVTDFGLRVTYDMLYRVTVTVPGNYRGKTCGLCGNFNDNKEDEFQLPDGKVMQNNTKDIVTFGAAWKVSVPGVVCEDGCSGDICPKCASDQKAVFEHDCKTITDAYGPFAACHSRIDAMPYYRDCVYDVCQAKGARKVLCESISAYMTDCQTLGVKVNSWRNEHFCPLSCSANSHYQVCAETCDKPCPGLVDTITCPETCAEGCACNDGYYFNGTGCVSLSTCSCYFQGLTYKLGESMVTDDCQQICTCTAGGQVQCDEMECGPAEICEVEKYVRGCYPKQCVLNGGLFTPFNGEVGSITVMGAYELIAACEYSSGSEWFRVVVSLQECTEMGQKTVMAVYVFLNDMIVTVTDKHDTWVNGHKVILPSLRNDVSVKANGKSVVIEKSSSFRLSYSRSQQVTVTVNDSMVGKVCGACGKLQSEDIVEFTLETMQERMAAFGAQDFPTCK